MRSWRIAPWVLLALAGCAGEQSALAPRGREALDIDLLFWTVTGISAVVTVLVSLLLLVALYGGDSLRARLAREPVIWAGGIVFPIVVLSGLFVYSLLVMNAGATRAVEDTNLSITVVGKRWWWDVTYEIADGVRVRSANELRLPVGQPVTIRLESDDVIHSFWVPHLAGKLDMIPGLTNVMTLEATFPGVSRGQCAEYCGGAHALMAFYVIALPEREFDAWLAQEAAPPPPPRAPQLVEGERLFLENGCGGCHVVKGTPATGTIGPDLSHVGSRRTLAAAALPNDTDAFARWIIDNQHLKPENLMPEYRYFEPEEVAAIAAYLDSLE